MNREEQKKLMMEMFSKSKEEAEEMFKKLRKTIEVLTIANYESHKLACEVWEHGEPVKAWFDADQNLCIEYEDGQYWHYNQRGEWF